MSGGTLQGNRRPENTETAEDVIARAKASLQPDQSNRPVPPETHNVSNFGLPSPDHERPTNAPGERDPLGIARGRKSPFK